MAQATQEAIPKVHALFAQGMTAYRINKLKLVPISRAHLYRIYDDYRRTQAKQVEESSTEPESNKQKRSG
ncbi:MAG: hypothetical protein F6K42_14700 [Leptolyngbya sp. SIO1D8]|nr:hypothetical protein [Leptolyngbya sp. SIO1D8]